MGDEWTPEIMRKLNPLCLNNIVKNYKTSHKMEFNAKMLLAGSHDTLKDLLSLPHVKLDVLHF